MTVITPPIVLKIRVITDAEAGRDHMTEFLHFAVREEFLERRIEAVDLRAHTQAHVKIEHVVETGRGIAHELLPDRVVHLVDTGEIHLVAQTDRRRDGQVFEEHEIGLDRQVMTDTRLPVAEEIRMHEIFLFHAVGLDLSVHGVTHADLLVPFFLAAYLSFAFERRLPP